MAIYDDSGKKIGRNSPCPCGSGKKYKHCHGSLTANKTSIAHHDIQEQIRKKIAEIQTKERAFKSVHGHSRPIISAEFNDWRIVAVGNELHFGKKEKTRYFPDFLGNYVRSKFGTEWGNSEIAKPLQDRHQILKWYDSICRFQAKQKPEVDGTYRTSANGSMLSWFRLAYDLYLIKHNAELQEKILQRLRNKQQFQGARFELCAAASMIVAGFEIKYEDESDYSRKHAEFLATHRSGVKIAVEAKSRHRDGVLEYKASARRTNKDQGTKVAIEGLIRNALAKEPDTPYFIFIDVNLPYSDENPHGNPWFKEMAESVENLRSEWQSGTFPANAIFFCNDPTYQEPERIAEKNNFWCYEVPIDDARHQLPDPQITLHVLQSIIRRINIPNEFPDE